MLRFSALALGACLVASTGHAQAVELAEDVSAPEGSETPRGFDDSASVAPARSTESVPDAPSRYGREAQRGQEALAPAVPDDGAAQRCESCQVGRLTPDARRALERDVDS